MPWLLLAVGVLVLEGWRAERDAAALKRQQRAAARLETMARDIMRDTARNPVTLGPAEWKRQHQNAAQRGHS